MAKSRLPEHCPCGAPLSFQQCCGRFISGQELAPDAEKLMRSRYTAYTLENETYLQKTWHPRSRPPLHFDKQAPAKWLALEIIAFHADGHNATVEFVARYKVSGKAQRLHEISKFEYEDGQWLYVDGTFPNQVN